MITTLEIQLITSFQAHQQLEYVYTKRDGGKCFGVYDEYFTSGNLNRLYSLIMLKSERYIQEQKKDVIEIILKNKFGKKVRRKRLC